MRVFAEIQFKPKPKEPLAERVRRVLHAVGEPGHGSQRVLFCLRDNPYRKTSAVARVLKVWPHLAVFRYQGPVARELSHYPPFAGLNNFPAPWIEHNPQQPQGQMPTDMLLEILDGIPRRFPFLDAAVTIDGVDWDGTGVGLGAGPAPDDHAPAPGFGRYLFSSVTLSGDTRRNFVAVIELPPDAPHVGGPVRAKLNAIGRVASERMRVRREGAELAAFLERRKRAVAFVDAFKAGLHDSLTRVSLPADLPPTIGGGIDKPFSVKPALVAAFRPLGYEYLAVQSGSGIFVLEKRTPAGHRLTVTIDRGTWSRSVTCIFSFSALEANHWLPLPAHADQTVHSNPVGGQDMVDAAVANWAAMVVALERDFAGELASIYRADPPWA